MCLSQVGFIFCVAKMGNNYWLKKHNYPFSGNHKTTIDKIKNKLLQSKSAHDKCME